MGINVWYLKLYYSVEDGLDRKDPEVKYPLRFLDPINSPEKLVAELDRARFDDFTKTGTFNREELDETFSAIARLLFRMKDVPYYFDSRLGPALREYVNQWQNPVTGFWGQWLVDREGRFWKMDDMAMTFHVVSDLNGEVNHLDGIAKRTLQMDKVNFPAGIRFDGHYENHLNWDVVKIFRLAWPYLDEPTRAQARAEIATMVAWCLAESYQPDGSFKVSELDDTVGDSYIHVWRSFPERRRILSAKRALLDLSGFSGGPNCSQPHRGEVKDGRHERSKYALCLRDSPGFGLAQSN